MTMDYLDFAFCDMRNEETIKWKSLDNGDLRKKSLNS